LIFREILRLHGLPRGITSDIYNTFIGNFWRVLWNKLGSNLLYNFSYHTQTDGHIKVVNQSLQILLRSLSGEKLGKWDFVLAQDKFSYNDSINRYVGKTPFHIVYGRSPKGFVDLVKLPNMEDKRNVDASGFIEVI